MRRGLVGLVAAIALLAGACSSDDTLSESEVKQQLIEAGLPEDLADCVAGEIGSVSAGDEQVIFDRAFDAGAACVEDAIDTSIPDISIPDVSINAE